MTRRLFPLAIALAVSCLSAHDALGQLFGERTLGRSISRQASPSAASRTTAARATGRTIGAAAAQPTAGETVPSLMTEGARFLRGNRAASDFVGTDAGETRRFVGGEQAGGEGEEIRSAIDNLQVETAPDANQTASAARTPRVPMNAPRLRVAFDFSPQVPTTVSDQLTRRLQAASLRTGASRIEVSVADGVATLRGAVASARDRKMAELLARFEPGIESVQNQLVVRPADSPPLPPPPVRD